MSIDINDFLRTQSLDLSTEDIQMNILRIQSVMQAENIMIEDSALWHDTDSGTLSLHLNKTTENQSCLKQLYLSLDSMHSQYNTLSSSVYLHQNNQSEKPHLLRLAHQGYETPFYLPLTEESNHQFLPCRTAQTAWLHQIDNIATWYSHQELMNHSLFGQSQLSIPICLSTGAVLGVVFASHQSKNAFPNDELADWIGFALAITDTMGTVHIKYENLSKVSQND